MIFHDLLCHDRFLIIMYYYEVDNHMFYYYLKVQGTISLSIFFFFFPQPALIHVQKLGLICRKFTHENLREIMVRIFLAFSDYL